jgi:YD repeat-containing protein
VTDSRGPVADRRADARHQLHVRRERPRRDPHGSAHAATAYAYDLKDHFETVHGSEGAGTGYTYDAGDRITQIADSPNGTITRQYDGLDRLTQETTPQGTVTYTYDADGRRATITVAGQSAVGYGYDDAHRLRSITQATAAVSIACDDTDRRSRRYGWRVEYTNGQDLCRQNSSASCASHHSPTKSERDPRSATGCRGRRTNASRRSSTYGGRSMDLAPDFDEFIGFLTAHGVEFVGGGAYALAFHGAPRFTGDLDILIRPTLDNAARLLAALAAFGFPVSDLSPEAITERRRMLQMGVPPVQIYVMSTISGVEWNEAWSERVEGSLGSHTVSFLGRETFLRNKRAAGRPKDLADIDALKPGSDV